MVEPVTPVTVRVWFNADPSSEHFVERTVAAIVGAEEEPFVDALTRTLGPLPVHRMFNLVRRGDDKTEEWLGWITPQVTMSDAAVVADGDVLQIDLLDRGDGKVTLMWDLVNAGLTVADAVQTTASVRAQREAGRLRTQRRVARAWVDAGIDGDPGVILQELVFQRPEWLRSTFDHTFDLDQTSGFTLLTRLGYTKEQHLPERWVETLPT